MTTTTYVGYLFLFSFYFFSQDICIVFKERNKMEKESKKRIPRRDDATEKQIMAIYSNAEEWQRPAIIGILTWFKLHLALNDWYRGPVSRKERKETILLLNAYRERRTLINETAKDLMKAFTNVPFHCDRFIYKEKCSDKFHAFLSATMLTADELESSLIGRWLAYYISFTSQHEPLEADRYSPKDVKKMYEYLIRAPSP